MDHSRVSKGDFLMGVWLVIVSLPFAVDVVRWIATGERIELSFAEHVGIGFAVLVMMTAGIGKIVRAAVPRRRDIDRLSRTSV